MANETIERREFEEHKQANSDEFKNINKRLVNIEETQTKLAIGQTQLTDQIQNIKNEILSTIEKNTQSEREKQMQKELDQLHSEKKEKLENNKYYFRLVVGGIVSYLVLQSVQTLLFYLTNK